VWGSGAKGACDKAYSRQGAVPTAAPRPPVVVTAKPTAAPTKAPTKAPTVAPRPPVVVTAKPTAKPTAAPTPAPLAASCAAGQACIAQHCDNAGWKQGVTPSNGLTIKVGQFKSDASYITVPRGWRAVLTASNGQTQNVDGTTFNFCSRGGFNDAVVSIAFSPLAATPAPTAKPTPPPKVNCAVSGWSAWGLCSKSCGGGTQIRTRRIATPARNGGAACPALSEQQSCNKQACPTAPPKVNCAVSGWSAWGSCSKSCGSGTQTRTRRIATPAKNGGAACPALSEQQSCNRQACPTSAPVLTKREIIVKAAAPIVAAARAQVVAQPVRIVAAPARAPAPAPARAPAPAPRAPAPAPRAPAPAPARR